MIYTSPYTHRARRGTLATDKPVRFKLHVVSHTHWDREWYGSFQQFRTRLVRLVDRLLDLMERSPEFRFFTFDGQTVLLEDYLEIRPENRERLRNLIQSGRIEIGPWYVLPDEFLVSGESLIRNLLAGQRVGAQFGGVMKVGYTPDSFGHVAQLPQILRGFQIDNIIFTRGLGEEQTSLGTEFLWLAPDGSRVLAINQLKGYCNGDHLGFEYLGEHHGEAPRFDLVIDYVRQEIAELGDAAKTSTDGTRHLLINNGCDHQEPQSDLPRLLAYANSVLPEAQLEHTSFSRFVQTLRRAGLALSDWSGELHHGKRHNVLAGVLSTRAYLKQQNDDCETLLTNVAEPLSVLVWQRAGMDNLSGFLIHAWKTLLKNHAHDSICGASIDRVHRDMLPRFDEVQQVGRLAIASAMEFIATRAQRGESPTLVVVNPSATQRTAVLRSLMLIPPGKLAKEISLVDAEGKIVPTVVLKTRSLSSQSEYSLPDSFLRVPIKGGADGRPLSYAEKHAQMLKELDSFKPAPRSGERPWRILELEYLASELPSLGYQTYSLKNVATSLPEQSVIVKGNQIENQWLRVKIARDGSLEVYHKPSKRTYGPLNVLEDAADLGDEYDFSPAERDRIVLSRNRKGKVKIISKSPLLAEVQVNSILALPEQYDRKLERRSKKSVRCPVQWKFSISAASPWVEVELRLQNLAKDHRLRVHADTRLATNASLAGQGFYMIQRPKKITGTKDWRQQPVPTQPMQRCCAVEDRRGGLAILAHGVYEYEALKGKKGAALALTLLRAVGWLSRPDLATRSKNAGPQIPTPEAQCLGEHVFRYAFLPYSGTAESNNLLGQAESYRTPILEEQCTGSGGNQPSQFSLLRCEPESIVVTAVKKCEHRDTLVVRLYNASNERVRGKIHWGMPVSHAWRVNFAESRLEEVTVLGKTRMELDFPAWRIQAIELEAGRKIPGL